MVRGNVKKHAAFLVVALLFTGYYADIAVHTDLSNDGAIYSQGVVTLYEKGIYGIPYFFNDPSQVRFSILNPGTLTQYIVEYPFIALFGVDNRTLQAANVLFLLLSGWLLYRLVLSATRSVFLSLLASVLFFTCPGMMSLGLGGFGEVPAFFYLLLTATVLRLAFDQPRYYPWLGLVCFLAVQTKLYLAPAFLVIFVVISWLWLVEKRARGRDLALFCGAFVLPILILHGGFLLAYGQKGLSVDYKITWAGIKFNQGEGGAGKLPLLSALGKGITAIRSSYGDPAAFYLSLVAGYLMSAVLVFSSAGRSERDGKRRWRMNLDATQVLILFMATLSVAYVGYWFHFSTGNKWYRHIYPFVLLSIPLYTVMAGYALNRWKGRRVIAAGAGAILLLPALAAHAAAFVATFEIPREISAQLRDRQQLTAFVRTLPPKERIFGAGLWRAPRIGLFTQRPVLDIYSASDHDDTGYFVMDNEGIRFGTNALRPQIDVYKMEPVFKSANYELYRWRKSGRLFETFAPATSAKIESYWPTEIMSGRSFNVQASGVSAIGLTTTGATPNTLIVWGETVLETVYGGPEFLTATVPTYLYALPGDYPLYLVDPKARTRSNRLFVKVAK
jgi:hypothetical protein